MSTALVVFAPGAIISATTLRTVIADVETYINEGIVAADRKTTPWLGPNHVYRPDFFGAPDPHTSLVSGESYFRLKSQDNEKRVFFSSNVNTSSWMQVPGLCATIQVPQSLRAGTWWYRLNLFASFYAYEYGGYGVAGPVVSRCDESQNLAATFGLFSGGLANAGLQGTLRYLYKGSQTSVLNQGAWYTRKQMSMAYASVAVTGSDTVDVGVCVKCEPAGALTTTKIIIVQQGGFLARYFVV
jgi:hypothetical protein